jgi:hypothetical protein
VGGALFRLAQARALQTLVRGTLPSPLLRRLFKDAMPRRAAADLPDEVWAALAASMGVDSPPFGMTLAQALHDRLAWDREPADPGEWERLGKERPLEALWMAALSETRTVRKTFPGFAAECVRAYRASPACIPPSWEFVEGILDIQSSALAQLREAERTVEDAERRFEAERQRSDDVREELKRLRRETSDLRAERAQAERKAAALEERAQAEPPADAQRLEGLERRLRKTEKENEHLRRELERAQPAAPPVRVVFEDGPPPAPAEDAGATRSPIQEDANPHRRVLRQILRRLFKKGKIGASHTHEDNVYRGLPDHDKGIAKQAVDLLYREGLLMPKPTATDPHVSLAPDKTTETRAIIAGEIENARLRRWVEEAP